MNSNKPLFIQKLAGLINLLILVWAFSSGVLAQAKSDKDAAISTTHSYAVEISKRSFPEIKINKLHVKTFKSEDSYFKARFSFGRFLTFRKMRHLIYVNPLVYERKAPEAAVRAILAHELAHVSYYTRKNRLELFGLSGLISRGFTAKFERKADLEAVAKGYGEGLIDYRNWLYKNIPEKKIEAKKRTYFSPEELKVMLELLRKKPLLIDVWRKTVPRNIEDIRKSV